MFTKKEIETVKEVIEDKILQLRIYATQEDTNKSEAHEAIVRIQYLTSALTKVEIEGDK